MQVSDVPIGWRLPEEKVQLTATHIVAGAIASRDFRDVHHDADRARSRGLTDIIMNIATTSGWISRFVTDWAGPHVEMREASVRLVSPNYPGDTVTVRGEVTDKVIDLYGHGQITVDVTIENQFGLHATGRVMFMIASGPAPSTPKMGGGDSNETA